jgi:nuclease S1
MRFMILVLTVTLCPIRSALTWGDTGHRIVCEIAFQELTGTAHQRVKQLIRVDGEFSRFSDACTWPDHPRKRADEHYVDLPRDADGIDADECPLADRCVLTAIDEDLKVLSSPTANVHEQLDALKFLGHWVADVHQPLHVSFEDDRGGNGVKVTGICGGNLHGVWDTCIVERSLGTDATAIASQLRSEITDQQRSEWLASHPIDWANESFTITTSPAVSYCVQTNTGCWYDRDRERLEAGQPEKTVLVDAAYMEVNAPIVRDRLSRAGVRLAGLLNKALDSHKTQ